MYEPSHTTRYLSSILHLHDFKYGPLQHSYAPPKDFLVPNLPRSFHESLLLQSYALPARKLQILKPASNGKPAFSFHITTRSILTVESQDCYTSVSPTIFLFHPGRDAVRRLVFSISHFLFVFPTCDHLCDLTCPSVRIGFGSQQHNEGVT